MGEPLTVTLELRKGHTVHPTDWVGMQQTKNGRESEREIFLFFLFLKIC